MLFHEEAHFSCNGISCSRAEEAAPPAPRRAQREAARGGRAKEALPPEKECKGKARGV